VSEEGRRGAGNEVASRGRYDSIVKEQKTTGYDNGRRVSPPDGRAALSRVDESGRFLILENNAVPPYRRINRGKPGFWLLFRRPLGAEPHTHFPL